MNYESEYKAYIWCAVISIVANIIVIVAMAFKLTGGEP